MCWRYEVSMNPSLEKSVSVGMRPLEKFLYLIVGKRYKNLCGFIVVLILVTFLHLFVCSYERLR